ncbi:hypothetical protein ACGF0J_11190 [Nonomuraea sp. NPDC047897]|uniref:hypothetical protein n=1 Tax=Nonomuraea sp. NPDC047897 TaxID=3364346 RepID=UPI00371FF688
MELQDSPLLKAAHLCLAGASGEEAAISATRVMEYVKGGDWETALLLLEDLGDAHPQSPEFWELLADAARLLWLKEDAHWYAWRGSEARVGAFRAGLHLLPAEDGGRSMPLLPRGRLEFLWDIGHRTSEGALSVSFAFLWIERRDPLQTGGSAPVRLLPLTPEHWRHLQPGDSITMHEARPPVGTALITEVIPPVAPST